MSFFGLTEFREASSVSSFQPTICVPKRTHRVFRRTHRVCPKTQGVSVSSLLRNSTLETVFRPFPNIVISVCGLVLRHLFVRRPLKNRAVRNRDMTTLVTGLIRDYTSSRVVENSGGGGDNIPYAPARKYYMYKFMLPELLSRKKIHCSLHTKMFLELISQ